MTKTIAEKLQIKPNTTVWVSDPAQIAAAHAHAGRGTRERLDWPPRAPRCCSPRTPPRRGKLMEENAADVTKPGVFWVAYPKGNTADINRDTLWPIVADFGMRPTARSRSMTAGRRCASVRTARARSASPAAARRKATEGPPGAATQTRSARQVPRHTGEAGAAGAATWARKAAGAATWAHEGQQVPRDGRQEGSWCRDVATEATGAGVPSGVSGPGPSRR